MRACEPLGPRRSKPLVTTLGAVLGDVPAAPSSTPAMGAMPPPRICGRPLASCVLGAAGQGASAPTAGTTSSAAYHVELPGAGSGSAPCHLALSPPDMQCWSEVQADLDHRYSPGAGDGLARGSSAPGVHVNVSGQQRPDACAGSSRCVSNSAAVQQTAKQQQVNLRKHRGGRTRDLSCWHLRRV